MKEPHPSNPTLDQLLAQASWVRDLAQKLVVDTNVADDLVQETWVSVLRQAPDQLRSSRAWLGQVMRNQLRNLARGESRRRQRERVVATTEALPSTAELYAEVDSHHQLVEELRQLDEPYASTLILRYFRGLEPKEIAELQGEKGGTVRWRLQQGLKLLRERLDRRCGGDQKSWIAMLAPLARPETTLVRGGVATAISGGLLVMTTVKIVVPLTIIAVTWFGLNWIGSKPSTTSTRASPSVATAAPPSFADATNEPSRERVEAPTISDEDADDDVAEGGGSGVRLTLVDDYGAPLLHNVTLDLDVPGEPRPVGATVVAALGEGIYEVFVEGLDVARGAGLSVTLPGYTREVRELRLEPDRILSLGKIELERAGRVEGRVVNGSGALLVNIPVRIGGIGDSGQDASLHTKTDRDGRFLFTSVPPGFVHVDARSAWSGRGENWVSSATFELRGGDVRSDITISLPNTWTPRPVSGRVVDASGEPVINAGVSLSESRGGDAIYVDTDHRGRFSLTPSLSGTSWIEASPPFDHRGGSSLPITVEDGDTNVILRLRARGGIVVRAIDSNHTPIDRFAVDVTLALEGQRGARYQTTVSSAASDGRREIHVPADPFYLAVSAVGMKESVKGPFDPRALPDEVEFTLEPSPVLRGRVTFEGTPVAGASVTAMKGLPRGIAWIADGFLVTYEPHGQHDTRTDAEGRFQLPASDSTVVIRAERFDGGIAESAPIDPQRHNPNEGIELTIGSGGTIEGRVLPYSERSVAGVIVGASTATGLSATTRSDEEGRYQLIGLPPGNYEVREAASEILPHTKTSNNNPQSVPMPTPWQVAVTNGGSTHFDVTLGVTAEIALVGSLSVDRGSPGPWRLELYVDRPKGTFKTADATSIRPDGTFRIVNTYPGRLRAMLRSGSSLLQANILRDFDLQRGETEWHVALHTGTLTLRADGPNPIAENSSWITILDDGAWAITTLQSSQAVPSFHVPAGPGWLVPGGVDDSAPRPERGDTPRHGVVPAGGDLTLH